MHRVLSMVGQSLGGFLKPTPEATDNSCPEPGKMIDSTAMHLDVKRDASWLQRQITALSQKGDRLADECLAHLRRGHVLPPRLMAQAVARTVTSGVFTCATSTIITGFLRGMSDWYALKAAIAVHDPELAANGRIIRFQLPFEKVLRVPSLHKVVAAPEPEEVDVDGPIEVSLHVRANLTRDGSGAAYVWSNNNCNTL